MSRGDYDNQSKEQARRQGRMALASLGERWFNEFRAGNPDAETFEQTHRRLATFAVDFELPPPPVSRARMTPIAIAAITATAPAPIAA